MVSPLASSNGMFDVLYLDLSKSHWQIRALLIERCVFGNSTGRTIIAYNFKRMAVAENRAQHVCEAFSSLSYIKKPIQSQMKMNPRTKFVA
jgi:hypothetical protein